MPKGSEKLTNARKEEIIQACAVLYETKSFKDITIRDIGEKTSFTRTSIYNYFQTKEEIFLALLQREHEAWVADLKKMIEQNDSMSVETFAKSMAHILERRQCMLKLMSMNIYDMEVNSRLENLVVFKKVYAEAFDTLTRCLKKFFPIMTQEDLQNFLYAFFPFLFGIHPFTSHTEKQLEAMKLAGVEDGDESVYGLVEPFVIRLLKSF
ncbi:MAG TPA: TetR/AcrR family transcriptional regulator [Candidatus Blautia intestinigallinarum]|nr:TetR/AcrR family transcriptional regulator [Candidatus Blautia intestinigallinarum]